MVILKGVASASVQVVRLRAMSNPSIEIPAKARIQIGRLNMASLTSAGLSTRIIFGHASCFVRELTEGPNNSV
jgi:hypothetical protein